jgi:hypothetical protein
MRIKCQVAENRQFCSEVLGDASEMQAMASRCKFETKLVAMKNTHHAKKTELIIGKDLT